MLQHVVRFGIGGVGGWVIDGLVDSGGEANWAEVEPTGKNWIEPHIENAIAKSCRIDRCAEFDVEAGERVEAVELVDGFDFGAITGERFAIGERQVDAAAGALAWVGGGEEVRGEGANFRTCGVELNTNAFAKAKCRKKSSGR